LDITDDNEDNYITGKSKLPSNFTKLGKWIMISGGSWVFNKKEKGSSDIREIPPQVTGADRRHHQPSLIRVHTSWWIEDQQEANAGDGDGNADDAAVC